MRVLDLTLKDLKQLARDWKSVTFLVAMPILFTVLFGFVFRGAGGAEDPRLPVAVVDRDGSAASRHLLAMLESSTAIRPVVPDEEDEVEGQVADQELAAAIIVPDGLGRAALSPGATGDLPRLEIIADPASPAGSTAVNAVQSAAARLAGAAEAAQLSARAYKAQGGVVDEAFLEEALAAAVEAWQDPALAVEARTSGAIAEPEEDEGSQASPFTHSSAGIMIQFAIAGIMGAAEIMVLERKSGALRRLLTTAIGRGQIILGHWLAMFVMILAQIALLILFGDLILGVDYLREPLGILLVAVTTALWTASMGLFIGTVARNEEHVIMITILSMLVLAGLGGAWMPLEFTGEAFQAVGRLTPTAWAIDGLENIAMRGLGFSSILLPAGILLGFSVAFMALALWRFRFE
jgi:ABC-2 type transport system permease protein